MRLRCTLVNIALALVSGNSAHACTVCESSNGHQLRAGLFDGHFLHTLGLVAAPMPVFIMVVVLVNFAAPAFPAASASLAAEPERSGALPALEPTA